MSGTNLVLRAFHLEIGKRPGNEVGQDVLLRGCTVTRYLQPCARQARFILEQIIFCFIGYPIWEPQTAKPTENREHPFPILQT